MKRPRSSNTLCVCISLSTDRISDSAQEWVRSQGGDVAIVPSGSGNDAWLAYSEPKSTMIPSRMEPFVVLSDPAFRIAESEKECSQVSADEIRVPPNWCPELVFSDLFGEFCLMVVDPRNERVWVSLDFRGVRPAYYAELNGYLFISTNICAMKALPGIELSLNYTYVLTYLSTVLPKQAPGSYQLTPFEGINALVPGTALEVDSQSVGTTTIGKWKTADSILPTNTKDLLRNILSDLSRAVGTRTVVAERPCVSLSGGLDSSAILALAALQSERHRLCALTTYRNDVVGCNELDYAREMAKKVGVECFEIDVGDVWHLKDPRNEPLRLPEPDISNLQEAATEKIRSICQGNGIDLLLTGLGGDQLFCARPWSLHDLIRDGHVKQTASHLRMWCERKNEPLIQGVWKYLIKPVRPGMLTLGSINWLTDIQDDKHARHLLRTQWPMVSEMPCLESATIADALFREIRNFTGETSDLGVVSRHPFFDHFLVRRCLSLPPGMRVNGPDTRGLQRLVLRDVLPERILNRRSKGGNFEALSLAFRKEWIRVEHLWTNSMLVRLGIADRQVSGACISRVRTIMSNGPLLSKYGQMVIG